MRAVDVPQKATCSIVEASVITGLSQEFLRDACRRTDGLRLPNVRRGRGVRVVTEALGPWMLAMAQAQAAEDQAAELGAASYSDCVDALEMTAEAMGCRPQEAAQLPEQLEGRAAKAAQTRARKKDFGDLLTVGSCAQLLRIAPDDVEAMCEAGELRSLRLWGQLRVDRDSAFALLAELDERAEAAR